jgi:hypothetical protein
MTSRHDPPTFAHRKRKTKPSQREQIRAAQAASITKRKAKPPTMPAPLTLKREK